MASFGFILHFTASRRSCPPEVGAILKDAWPIESVEGCRAFELHWKRYAAYLVTEELVGGFGQYDDEVYSGRILRVYTKSHFLSNLLATQAVTPTR